MTALEIVLLLIGVICVAASFILFVKSDGSTGSVDINTELSAKQKDDIKSQIASIFDKMIEEKSNDIEEITESALEKISNKKIQELSEYSETVLSEINKNHNEAVFLYDMLNEKSKEVHNNVRDINIAADNMANKFKDIEAVFVRDGINKTTEDISEKEVTDNLEFQNAINEEQITFEDEGNQSVSGGNKKDDIFSLYKEGKTNVEIAKILGLGVGEVKLIIDLYKGKI